MREPEDGGADPADGPDAVRAERIVPVVRDARSALRAPLPDRLALTPRTKATVQHALLRGIEITSQPEEGEVLGEPLPSREDRRAISFHEAAEGGGRRPRPPHRAFRRLGRPPARAVLELMHVHGLDEAIAAGDPAILTDDAEANCARGRYRCLLSCFNQPDHELIDRTDEEAKHELLGIARGRVTRRAGGCDAAGDDPWTDAFQRHRLPEPTPAVFPSAPIRPRRGASTTWPPAAAPFSEGVATEAAAMGWTLVELPSVPSAGVPETIVEALGGPPS